jgi:hypothetical protein
MEGWHAVGRSAPTGDDDIGASVSHGFEQPPEGLRAGDRRRPASVVLVIAAVIGLLVWQPWGSDNRAALPPGSPTPVVARLDGSHAPSSGPDGTGAPTPPPAVDHRTADSPSYVSITDNEWTVVALLVPVVPVSTEEPATQHGAGAAWSPGGPFLVLQQGLIPVEVPVERADDPGAPCIPGGVPRDRTAVPVPVGRVAYLGVTVPGTVPRPEVTAAIVGGPAGGMTRAISPTVQLAGMVAGRRYLIPSSGPGGAILFAPAAPGPLPSGVYRFEVASPGAAGNRYLYACVAP